MEIPENTLIVTDQMEREFIWSALEEYRRVIAAEEHLTAVDALIKRVQQTFSWMRNPL